MKTEVIMKRELFGKHISQKSKSEFFSATDLVKAGNIWRMSNGMSGFDLSAYLKQVGTSEFIKSLEGKYGQVKISGRGRGSHTWVHPLLFIDIALAISPKLKIEVYEWIMDSLLKYRNNSGDSYKKMCGSLFITISNKSRYQELIVSTANKIRIACGVKDWQEATEEQLKQRDKMHENIALLCDVLKNPEDAVRIGILKSK